MSDAKRKVLLVDDDEAFLDATALLLEDAGFEVLKATDGPSGLAAAREHRPDAIVLDVIMRRPDEGFATARAIRADPALKDCRLMLLTAVGRRYQMLFEPDDLWLPVDKVVEKPASAEELIAELNAMFSDQQQG